MLQQAHYVSPCLSSLLSVQATLPRFLCHAKYIIFCLRKNTKWFSMTDYMIRPTFWAKQNFTAFFSFVALVAYTLSFNSWQPPLFVYCAFLFAMATPVRKTFTTDVGQMQRRRHHMTRAVSSVYCNQHFVALNFHLNSLTILGVIQQHNSECFSKHRLYCNNVQHKLFLSLSHLI